MSRHQSSSHLVIFAAASWAFCALVVLLVNGRWPTSRNNFEGEATTLGALGFAAAIVAPLLLLIGSFRLRDDAQRRAVWLGCGLFAIILAAITMFSVGSVFLVLAGILGWAWWTTRRTSPSFRTWTSSLLSGWIVGASTIALWMLFLRDTPMCWNASGWSPTASATHVDCTSDIVDSLEGALALGVLALGFAGVTAILCMWPPSD
ncbi:MAG: hypothetical protein ACJ789_08975 [Thermomicrobiales bacterium]